MRRHHARQQIYAEHVSPTVKHEPIPRNRPILARDEGKLEGIGIFTAPGNNSV